MDRYNRKLNIFCELGRAFAKLSTCKRRETGAVVFPVDCSAVLAVGYNGPARGLPNDACTGQVGACGCAHAESNAITKLSPNIMQPCLMFTTLLPCIACANAIVNCGMIVGILYDTEYRNERGNKIITQAGISIVHTDHLGDSIHDQVRQWRDIGRIPERATSADWAHGVHRL